jgi:hypothetical protein
MQQKKIVASFGLGDFGPRPPSRLDTMLAILNVQSRLYAEMLLSRHAFSAILSKTESCHFAKVSGYMIRTIESASQCNLSEIHVGANQKLDDALQQYCSQSCIYSSGYSSVVAFGSLGSFGSGRYSLILSK